MTTCCSTLLAACARRVSAANAAAAALQNRCAALEWRAREQAGTPSSSVGAEREEAPPPPAETDADCLNAPALADLTLLMAPLSVAPTAYDAPRPATAGATLEALPRPPPLLVGGEGTASAAGSVSAAVLSRPTVTSLAESASLPSLSATSEWERVPRAVAGVQEGARPESSSFRRASPGRRRRSQDVPPMRSLRGGPGARGDTLMGGAEQGPAALFHNSRRTQLLAWRDLMRLAESEAASTRAEFAVEHERRRAAAADPPAATAASAPTAGGGGVHAASPAPTATAPLTVTMFSPHKALLERSLRHAARACSVPCKMRSSPLSPCQLSARSRCVGQGEQWRGDGGARARAEVDDRARTYCAPRRFAFMLQVAALLPWLRSRLRLQAPFCLCLVVVEIDCVNDCRYRESSDLPGMSTAYYEYENLACLRACLLACLLAYEYLTLLPASTCLL